MKNNNKNRKKKKRLNLKLTFKTTPPGCGYT